MTAEFPLYWIPLLPLLGAAINLLMGQKLGRQSVVLIACGSVLGSLLVGLYAGCAQLYPLWAEHVAAHHGEGTAGLAPALVVSAFDWISAGDLSIDLGLLFDPLGAVMVFTVTFVGFLIHVYSAGYMHHDPDYARFFGYLNLFTGSMLLLVLGDNLVVLFVGWEGVGLCSYLLIGFWYDKSGTETLGTENASAGRKAFIVNRVGDFAFLVGMFLIFSTAGTLNIAELSERTDSLMTLWSPLGLGTVSVAAIASVLLLTGATGKSAQIPLYVWLPDAMAGPTPVSALIHAATMVTAGVYMVARLNFMYMLSPTAMGIVALVGGLTALFAATIGFAQNDIKKVLAYSTISQLGYMFLAVGVGAFAAGVFHLFTHAFFKACLFLGAGSVIHAMSGKQDIREMGGLSKKMPLTHITFLVSCLAIAGIPIFAGFFSKDEILWKTIATANPAWPVWFPILLYVLGVAAALCTAFYMFRLYYLTFSGASRADEETKHHIHESPVSMTMPLVVLAIGATGIGLLGMPGATGILNVFHHWLAPVVDRGAVIAAGVAQVAEVKENHLAHNHALEWGLMAMSVGVALVGIFTARAFYRGGFAPTVASITGKIPRLHALVSDKYRIDELYRSTIVKPLQWGATYLWRVVDEFIIDLMGVLGSARIVDGVGYVARKFQSGNVQRYLTAVVVGLAVIVGWAAWPPDRLQASPGPKVKVGEAITFTVNADGADSGRSLEYRWDFDGDGAWDSDWKAAPKAQYTFDKAGVYKARVRVKDSRWGTAATESVRLEVE